MYTRRNFIKNTSQLSLLGALGCQRTKISHGRDEIVSEFHLQKKLLGQKLRVLYPKGSLSNLQPIVSRFEAATHSKVELVESSLNEIASEMQILSSFAADNQMVDVALPPTFTLPDLVESEVIADLTSYAERFEPESLKFDMLYPDGDAYKGRFYGYQTDGDLYLLLLNRTILQQLSRMWGQKEADLIPKSWSELDHLMRKAQQAMPHISGGLLFRNRHYLHWEFWSRLHASGRLPFSTQMESQLLSDESFVALEEMVRASSSLDPASFDDGLFQNWERFSRGESLANLGWGGTYKYLKKQDSNVETRYIVAPLPDIRSAAGQSTFGYFNWGWNLVVLEKSKQKELAYLFCLFASLPEESTLGVQSIDGYFDPHRISHYLDPQIRKLYGTQFLDVQNLSFKAAIPDLYLKNSASYFSSLKQGLHSVLTGVTKPKIALQLVHSKWNQITEMAGVKAQTEQWNQLLKKYPQSVRGILK